MAFSHLQLEDGTGSLLLEAGVQDYLLLEPVIIGMDAPSGVDFAAPAIVYLNPNLIDAACSYGAFSGDAVLDNLNVKAIACAGVLGAWESEGSIAVNSTLGLAVAASYGGFTATASLDVSRSNGIVAACSWGPMRGTATLLTVPGYGRSDYVEDVDSRLLGETDLAVGPGQTLLVSASDSRTVSCVVHNDPQRLYIAHSHQFAGRVLAITSSADYYFVLEEETQQADPAGLPKLHVFPQTTFDADELSVIDLPRGIQPRFLWGPLDGESIDPASVADFLVLTGADGAVQIRKADPTLELFAEQATGAYAPRVVEAVRQPDLDRTLSGYVLEVWHILIFSERSAQGFVLKYEHITASTNVVADGDRGDINLHVPATYGIAMTAELVTP
jgi:hypothetical protein